MKTRSGALMLWALLGAPFAFGGEASAPAASRSAPLPTWTGFYAGVNTGGLWSNSGGSVDWSRLAGPSNLAFSSGFASVPQSSFAWANGPGFAGGGQVGYNWQITNNIVVGVETDFQGIAGGGTNSGGFSNFASSKAPAYVGSVRGRGGYLVSPNLQLYGTGGFAYSGGN
jgi:outer membrane immunogenic protein